MQVPAERLLAILRTTLDRLLGPADSFGSDQEAVRSALTLLHNRERGGAGTQRRWLNQLARQADELGVSLELRSRAPELAQELDRAAIDARSAAGIDCLQQVEEAARQVHAAFAHLAGTLCSDPRLDRAARTRAALALAEWEVSRINAMAAGRVIDESQGEGAINSASLQRYLADRFTEPGIAVTELRALPGGFGKETVLFSVAGQALSGDFVMRRDRDKPTFDNDCHRIVNEYPVIRAAFQHGFKAPDAVWLDTEHRLLPGGDFIIMRRAPGSPGGSVFSAANTISDDLLNVLAGTLAGLHALPPLHELGDLTESINSQMWSLTRGQAMRRYIAGYREAYLRAVSEPSPGILALYGWVLDNLVDAPGRSVLCHGDVGFHNMVLDQGRLSALVDWEFAHVGDPADDLAYVRNTAGATLDWKKFLAAYRAAGGSEVSPEQLHLFQVWGQLRNATASAVTVNCFITGKLDELKFTHTGFYHQPSFLAEAARMVAAGPARW